MSVVLLKPAYKDYLWGGTKLKQEFHKEFAGEVLAESWELSCHKDGESIVASGELRGTPLSQYIEKRGRKILGGNCTRFEDFPILIKLIDARDNLSIQVHPDNAYALEKEGQFGKTEMWYVVDCEPGACLYYGFSRPVSREELKDRIAKQTLTEVLNKVEVKKGDVFFIGAGTIHAIGKGIVIAEIQQNSNVTYRVYDYGRVGVDGKQRELHIDKAAEVTNLYPNTEPYDFHGHLGECEYFVTDKVVVDGTWEEKAEGDSFHCLLAIEGSGEVVLKEGGEKISFRKGDCLLIEADSGEYQISGTATILKTKVGRKVYRIGVDLGGTNIKVGIVDENKKIIAKKSVKTLSERPYQEVIADMGKAVLSLLDEQKILLTDCVSLGIGSPGVIDAEKGVVIYSNNLEWNYVPLTEELKKYVNLPIYASNDANCAALGEVVAGAAKGTRNALLFTLGTGVGGGIVIEGKVFEGGHPGGAELGHCVLVVDGELCTCGRRGCFEAYASATALIRNTKRAAEAHPESLLNTLCGGDIDKIDGVTPFDAAKKGDAAGKQVVADYIKYLGEGIADMVNIFRPEVVLLSGGVCNQGEYLTKPVNECVRKACFGGTSCFVPEVTRATLGNDAGIIGAAMLS